MKRLAILLSGLCSQLTFAAPNDLFLQAQTLKPQNERLSIQASVDAVNDTLDILDVRDDQGSLADGAGDYLGGNIEVHYALTPNFSLEGSYWYREIDYARDTNTIHSWLLGATYIPDWQVSPSSQLAFRTTVWGDNANKLKKSSPTMLNDQYFEKIQVNDARDVQLQLDAIFSHRLNSAHQLNAFASLGYSKVDVDSLDAQANYNGCLVDLNVQSDNLFTGVISPTCGGGTISGDASSFGLQMEQDLQYEATYASLGGSWNWRYHKFESQLAYQYQRLWRQDIDDRIEYFGSSAIKDNHSIGLKLSYDFMPHLSGFIQGQFFENNFIGTIPFLYNGVTASRLDRNYGYASVGLKLHSF